MFIPLSIDRVETSKMPYFATNAKIAVMASILISYAFLVSFILKNTTSLVPLYILTGMYIILLYYMVRMYMFEEGRLKKLVKELDKNKVSTSNYFSRVQNVTGKSIIRYQHTADIRYAIIVKVYRGSKVGVPSGFMEQQIEVLNDFLRSLHTHGFSFERYEMNKSYEMSDSLKNSANQLKTVEDDVLLQFHRLQVEALSKYSEGQTSEIVDYFVIYGSKISQIRTFRDVVEDIITETFEGSRYFTRTQILDKDEVRKFFQEVLNLKSFNMSDVKMNNLHQDVEDFATVTRLFKGDEEIIEIEGDKEEDFNKGIDLNLEIEKEEEKEKKDLESRENKFRTEFNKVLARYDRNIIGGEELREQEFRLFDEIFTEEDIPYISESMVSHYQVWERKKREDYEGELELLDAHIELEDDFEEEEVVYGVDLSKFDDVDDDYFNKEDVEGEFLTLEDDDDLDLEDEDEEILEFEDDYEVGEDYESLYKK